MCALYHDHPFVCAQVLVWCKCCRVNMGLPLLKSVRLLHMLQGQYETRLLEQSIYKICALLAVGFGDAGAEVIAENIKKEGDLNPCMPGKKTVRLGVVLCWRGGCLVAEGGC